MKIRQSNIHLENVLLIIGNLLHVYVIYLLFLLTSIWHDQPNCPVYTFCTKDAEFIIDIRAYII